MPADPWTPCRVNVQQSHCGSAKCLSRVCRPTQSSAALAVPVNPSAGPIDGIAGAAGTAVDQSGPLTPAQLTQCAITQQDFEAAIKKVQPSVRREGFATTPDVSWEDIGSLAEVCSPRHAQSQLT